MPFIIQILFDNWPTLGFILLALVIFLGWLTWKAHTGKITTGYEGLVGKEGVYKGNNLVQVNGELWRIDTGHQLNPEDIVEVTDVQNLKITVEKRS